MSTTAETTRISAIAPEGASAWKYADPVEQAAMNAAWHALESGGTDADIEQAAMDAAWHAIESR